MQRLATSIYGYADVYAFDILKREADKGDSRTFMSLANKTLKAIEEERPEIYVIVAGKSENKVLTYETYLAGKFISQTPFPLTFSDYLYARNKQESEEESA